jgi:pilus assembly protein CpaF
MKEVTDISFNGEGLYYVSNIKGRMKASFGVSVQEVGGLLREIANLSERQFSYSSPILDVSFSRYRLNAVFSSLARCRNEKTYTFSLRLAAEKTPLDDDPSFFSGESQKILLSLLNQNESIVIGGQTGSGKTELEKWLLYHLQAGKRVIVIDNVEELDMVKNPMIDLSTWLVNPSLPGASFPALIKNALRNNPDYIVVAEARGEEMMDALLSAMSGHPIIMTIHAKDITSLPERMARLAMLTSEKLVKEEILEDVLHHFHYYVYLEKGEKSTGVFRRIQDVAVYKEKEKKMISLLRSKCS